MASSQKSHKRIEKEPDVVVDISDKQREELTRKLSALTTSSSSSASSDSQCRLDLLPPEILQTILSRLAHSISADEEQISNKRSKILPPTTTHAPSNLPPSSLSPLTNPTKNLAAISQVNKYFREQASDDTLWKKLFEERYEITHRLRRAHGDIPELLPPPPPPPSSSSSSSSSSSPTHPQNRGWTIPDPNPPPPLTWKQLYNTTEDNLRLWRRIPLRERDGRGAGGARAVLVTNPLPEDPLTHSGNSLHVSQALKAQAKSVKMSQMIQQHGAGVWQLILDSEKDRLYSNSSNDVIKLWSLDDCNCKEVSSLEGVGTTPDSDFTRTFTNPRGAHPTCYTPFVSYGLLATGSSKITFVSFDSSNQLQVPFSSYPRLTSGQITFSQNGRKFICVTSSPPSSSSSSGSASSSFASWYLKEYDTEKLLGIPGNDSGNYSIAETNSWKLEMEEQCPTITCLEPNDRQGLICCGHADGQISLFDSRAPGRGMIIKTSSSHQATIWALRCTENKLFSGTSESVANCYDVRKISKGPLAVFRGHKGLIGDLDVDEYKLATASNDGTVRLWDISSSSSWEGIEGSVILDTSSSSSSPPAARQVLPGVPLPPPLRVSDPWNTKGASPPCLSIFVSADYRLDAVPERTNPSDTPTIGSSWIWSVRFDDNRLFAGNTDGDIHCISLGKRLNERKHRSCVIA